MQTLGLNSRSKSFLEISKFLDIIIIIIIKYRNWIHWDICIFLTDTNTGYLLFESSTIDGDGIRIIEGVRELVEWVGKGAGLAIGRSNEILWTANPLHV